MNPAWGSLTESPTSNSKKPEAVQTYENDRFSNSCVVVDAI